MLQGGDFTVWYIYNKIPFLREVIVHPVLYRTTTEQVVNPSMATSSPMRTSSWSTPSPCFCLWRTRGLTPTVRSFSSPLVKWNKKYVVRISHHAYIYFSWLTVSCPWLDGKHVVFGSVTDGAALVSSIEAQGTPSGKTKTSITIRDCGEIKSA